MITKDLILRMLLNDLDTQEGTDAQHRLYAMSGTSYLDVIDYLMKHFASLYSALGIKRYGRYKGLSFGEPNIINKHLFVEMTQTLLRLQQVKNVAVGGPDSKWITQSFRHFGAVFRAFRKMEYRSPTYYVTPELSNALMQTVPPSDIPLNSFKIPLNAMDFMLPIEATPEKDLQIFDDTPFYHCCTSFAYFNGLDDLAKTSVKIASFLDPLQIECLVSGLMIDSASGEAWDIDLQQPFIILRLYPWSPGHELMDVGYSSLEFPDLTFVIPMGELSPLETIRKFKDVSFAHLNEKSDVNEEMHAFHSKGINMVASNLSQLFNLLLYLQELPSELPTAKEKILKPAVFGANRKVKEPVIWRPNVIGEKFSSQNAEFNLVPKELQNEFGASLLGDSSQEELQRTVSMHWRRGHWRRARVNDLNELLGWRYDPRWIKPVLVNAPKE